MTRTFTPLQSALCLALLSGCSGPSSDSLSPHPTSNAPLIDASSKATQTARASQQLSFEVTARDPQGSALSFSWSANLGTLGTPSSDDSSSHVTWTAPACAAASTIPTLTATVTNASQLTASQSFTVSGLPSCASWSKLSSPNSAHPFSQSTLLPDGRVLVSGGAVGTGPDDAEVYDPVTDQWSHAGSPGETHPGSTATLLLDGTVLVTGGINGNTNPVIYSPTTNTWHPTGAMVAPRSVSYTATLLPNGKVLVAGGYVGALLSPEVTLTGTAELYDPATGTWSPTGSMSHIRVSHAALLLPDGKVLVIGGLPTNDPDWPRTSELYDPATGTWSPTGAMAKNRVFETPTPLLLGGKVFVSGADTDSAVPLMNDESYDPATGTWSAVGIPHEKWGNHTATLLENGQVLIAGGACTDGLCGTSKLYDPVTSTWSAPIRMIDYRRLGATGVRLLTGQVLVVGGLGGRSAELYTP